MNIHVDDAIFRLQANGGISRLWRSLMPHLQAALPDATWSGQRPPDVFISTYYQRAPIGVPSVAVVYDYIAERYPGIGAHHPDAVNKRQAVADADAVVGISQWVADDCQRFSGKRAMVAYCGGAETFQRALPAEVDTFQKQYGILKPYVLMVGKRGLYKNARALYQAWDVWQTGTDHLLLCIGGEPETRADLDFDRRHPNVRVRLDVSDQALAAAYSGATALVYPSLYEGFGLPVLEAMICGCPVVCGDGGSLHEVGGDAPFYCDPLLPLSIAAALHQTLDPSQRLKHALAGYAQAKPFTWANMAASVAEAIRSAA